MEYLISWFLGIFKNAILTIISISIAPIDYFLQKTIPDFSTHLITVNTYLNNYLFRGLQWTKMVFFNLTNINPFVWYFFLTPLLIMLFVGTNFVLVKFGLNVWRLVHGQNGGK